MVVTTGEIFAEAVEYSEDGLAMSIRGEDSHMRLRRLSLFLAAFATLCASLFVRCAERPCSRGPLGGDADPEGGAGKPRPYPQRAIPPKLPTVVIITTAADGTHSGTWASTSQNGVTPIGKVEIDGQTIRISVPMWRGAWEGKLSADGSKARRQMGAETV